MLVITLGEPYSVNIEHIAACLAQQAMNTKVQVIGSYWHWSNQLEQLKMVSPKNIEFVDIGGIEKPAQYLTLAERGKISVAALQKLKSIDFKGKCAVLTAPIDKFACHETGFRFPGQTEFFEDLWQQKGIMLLAGPKLRVAIATNHVSLASVTPLIQSELLEQKIISLHQTLQKIFNITQPRIGICGLNPHCGDQGMFGYEEMRCIEPLVKKMSETQDYNVSGPFPADTIFWQMMNGKFDAILAMYHDQGLGPLKTVHFDDAVNITGGLPYLRIAPDHGPAKDLYLTKKSSGKSFVEAFRVIKHYLGS